MNTEQSGNPTNPIGIYRNPVTKDVIGVTDAVQADAITQPRYGFVLVKPCSSTQEVYDILAAQAEKQADKQPQSQPEGEK